MPAIVVGSPEWWVRRLSAKLDKQAKYAKLYADYYNGDQPLKFAQEVWSHNFGALFPDFAFNFCRLIADSVAERMTVEGFRMGDAPEGDKAARAIWQRNGMDAGSKLAHTEALVGGIAYALVWYEDPEADATLATITAESPQEVIVELDPADRRRRLAGMKRVKNERGEWTHELWTAETDDAPAMFYRIKPRRSLGTTYEVETEAKNPLGVVPIVPIIPQPFAGSVRSELATVAPMNDTLNKIMADMLVASEFAGFPQRYVTGLELEEDPAAPGRPKIPWRVGIDRMLSAPDPDAKFGAFPTVDLNMYVQSMQAVVQNMAAVSRVPFHYFLLNGGQAPSGEAIQSAEAGLIAVVRDRCVHVGESWEEVIRLALRIEGSEVDDLTETMWAEPAYRSEAVVVDAAVKKDSLGVPREQLYADIGYSQAEIARFRSMRAREQLDRAVQAALNPTPPPAPVAAPPAVGEGAPAQQSGATGAPA